MVADGLPLFGEAQLGLKSKAFILSFFVPNYPPQLDCCIHVYVVQRPVNELHEMHVTGPGVPSLFTNTINSSSDRYSTGHPMNTPDSESIDSLIQN